MCDVCKVVGINSLFINGPKSNVMNAKLYKVYSNRVANLKLCRIHDIELFLKGEQRFLTTHLSLAREIVSKANN